MASKLEFVRFPAPDGVNGWWETLLPAQQAKSVVGERHFDFAVVGGGITGLCAARRLAELAPEASIALIEADRIGRSTAGRNSGFFVDLPHDISSESYSRSVEVDKADVRLQRHGIDYVRSTVRQHGIDCDWRDDGKFHASVYKKGHTALEHFAEGLDRIDEPYQWLDEAAITKVTGTRFYRGALFTPGCSTVQPAALMRGLAATQPGNVNVFESSAVTSMGTGGQARVLDFAAGKIVAKQVILCTNAYAATFGGHPNGLLPVYTFASMSRVMNEDEVAKLGGQSSWALIPADPMGTTVRRLSTNRICVRNHFAFRPDLAVSAADLAKARHMHQRSFDRRFPMLKNVELQYTWGGALCLSANNGALFGQRSDGVFEAVGCNGLGLSRGSAAGKLIAEFALGQSNVLIEQLLKQPHPRSLPMRPIADVAVSAAIWMKEFSAGAEL
ncbi:MULTISPECIES: FAD-binding oxidoreductase [unclassified Caballeronia]|uniref:NAD(P)/FAD-dependent oxidoreductase n=1 Tax=unclassified Caballeronia TaxID=2646786 RepID=UPI002857A38A|nr:MULTISPECIES: FAD-binding oxidoreductase [unclassified Caballeronia]MDR5777515.1 FAD-binding oxidoreductase [Caballeronia sp. LZ002]MDR5798584.1 FAD-binding oxidoreductase [Caballeronia sp. LZ001]MDR5852945.1 FAD-binding oxidoreductase [Caballeronia sp. LZ003]